nr:phospholipid carrier-dependent glycosyltransferase [Clostridia bacterium]
MAYAAFEAPFEIDSLIVYKGLGTCGITVYIPSESGDSWIEVTRQVCDSIYAWERIPLGCTAELICVSIGADAQAELFEIGFLSSTGEVIAVLSDGSALFDEQALVPDMPDYQNGMYFDEIFHARTAYEHINGLQPYEISHPPLGKLLISVGILLFGMNPFGWRIAG